jgi:phospholipid/cholesterol/gamma-HCH transport system ATP-binding protein
MRAPQKHIDTGREVILSARDVCVAFGRNVVLDHLDLDVYRGEILGFVGGSGTGKSVLMRSILRLIPRQKGMIRILGEDYDTVDEATRISLDMRHGCPVSAWSAVFGADSEAKTSRFRCANILIAAARS